MCSCRSYWAGSVSWTLDGLYLACVLLQVVLGRVGELDSRRALSGLCAPAGRTGPGRWAGLQKGFIWPVCSCRSYWAGSVSWTPEGLYLACVLLQVVLGRVCELDSRRALSGLCAPAGRTGPGLWAGLQKGFIWPVCSCRSYWVGSVSWTLDGFYLACVLLQVVLGRVGELDSRRALSGLCAPAGRTGPGLWAGLQKGFIWPVCSCRSYWAGSVSWTPEGLYLACVLLQVVLGRVCELDSRRALSGLCAPAGRTGPGRWAGLQKGFIWPVCSCRSYWAGSVSWTPEGLYLACVLLQVVLGWLGELDSRRSLSGLCAPAGRTGPGRWAGLQKGFIWPVCSCRSYWAGSVSWTPEGLYLACVLLQVVLGRVGELDSRRALSGLCAPAGRTGPGLWAGLQKGFIWPVCSCRSYWAGSVSWTPEGLYLACVLLQVVLGRVGELDSRRALSGLCAPAGRTGPGRWAGLQKGFIWPVCSCRSYWAGSVSWTPEGLYLACVLLQVVLGRVCELDSRRALSGLCAPAGRTGPGLWAGLQKGFIWPVCSCRSYWAGSVSWTPEGLYLACVLLQVVLGRVGELDSRRALSGLCAPAGRTGPGLWAGLQKGFIWPVCSCRSYWAGSVSWTPEGLYLACVLLQVVLGRVGELDSRRALSGLCAPAGRTGPARWAGLQKGFIWPVCSCRSYWAGSVSWTLDGLYLACVLLQVVLGRVGELDSRRALSGLCAPAGRTGPGRWAGLQKGFIWPVCSCRSYWAGSVSWTPEGLYLACVLLQVVLGRVCELDSRRALSGLCAPAGRTGPGRWAGLQKGFIWPVCSCRSYWAGSVSWTPEGLYLACVLLQVVLGRLGELDSRRSLSGLCAPAGRTGPGRWAGLQKGFIWPVCSCRSYWAGSVSWTPEGLYLACVLLQVVLGRVGELDSRRALSGLCAPAGRTGPGLWAGLQKGFIWPVCSCRSYWAGSVSWTPEGLYLACVLLQVVLGRVGELDSRRALSGLCAPAGRTGPGRWAGLQKGFIWPVCSCRSYWAGSVSWTPEGLYLACVLLQVVLGRVCELDSRRALSGLCAPAGRTGPGLWAGLQKGFIWPVCSCRSYWAGSVSWTPEGLYLACVLLQVVLGRVGELDSRRALSGLCAPAGRTGPGLWAGLQKGFIWPVCSCRSYWAGSVSWTPEGLYLACVLKRGSLLMLARLGGLVSLSTTGCSIEFGSAHFLPLHPLVTYR